MSKVLTVGCLLLISLSLTTLSPAQAQQDREKIIVAGAQSVIPLAEAFSAQFRKDHPGVEIEIRAGGSNYAIRAARRGDIDIGLVTRTLSPAEKTGLHVKSFGRDAIILLTYPGNPVSNLTMEQIRRIYLGQITNWREVGGQNKGIIALMRENSSSLRKIFLDHLFGRGFNGQLKTFTIRARKDKVLKTIKRIEGSIGYGVVDLEEAEVQGVEVLRVGGKLPTAENIREGSYPLTRPHLLISRETPTGVVQGWMLSFTRFASQGTSSEGHP